MNVENDPDLLRARHDLMAEEIEKEINALEYFGSLSKTTMDIQIILFAMLDLIKEIRKES